MRGPVRRVRAYAGLFALLSLLAFVAAGLAAGTPRVVNHLADRALREDVARLPYAARDLTLSVPVVARQRGLEVNAAQRLLDRFQHGMPAPLPDLVGDRWFSGDLGPDGASTIVPSGPRAEINVRAQTGVREAVRITSGRWPATRRGSEATELALSVEVAAKLGVRLGTSLTLGGFGGDADVVVVGLFEPLDPGAPVWDEMPLALDTPWPQPEQPFRAVAVTDVTGLTLAAEAVDQLSYTWRYRLATSELNGDRLGPVRAAVTQVRRTTVAPQPPNAPFIPIARLNVATALDTALDRFAGQLRSARSLLSVVQAGLLATLFGLVALAGGLAVERRREEFALLRARGASVLRIGGRSLAEPLLVVPLAVLAGWLAGTLAPGRPADAGWAVLVAAVVATAVVPVLAMVSQRRPTFVARRRDLTRHRPSPRRLTAELLVLLVGVLGAYLLRRRGLGAPADSGGGVDPYLSSVPVLLATGAALVVLRLVPWPLAWMGRLTARAAGAVPFLGLARAGRAAPLTVGPVAVLVIAITTGVFAGAVNGTIRAARDRVAVQEIPADARVAAVRLPLGTAEGLAKVPGVTAVSPLIVEGGATIRSDRRHERVVIAVVDPVTFDRVAQASGVDVRVPPALAAAPAGRLPAPAVVSPDVAAELAGGAEAELRTNRYAFTVSVVRESFPGLDTSTRRFVVLPAQALPEGPTGPLNPDRFLLTGDGIDPAAVLAAIDSVREAAASDDVTRATVPSEVTVTTRAELRESLESTGANEVLSFTYLVGAAGGAALALLAVGFAVLAGARPRGRALSRLRTMGLSRRQSRSLLAYELVPLVGAAAVAGGLVGVALPGLLAPALGLAQFTAGQATLVRLDPLLIGGLLALVVTALALAITVENMINRRLRLNEVLRLGEEDE